MNLNTVISLRAHADDTPIAGVQTERHGLPITIEHPRGTQRKLHDDKGNVVYKVHMHHSYGFFNGTKGRDGDEVDCFVGPMKDAKEVYVIHMKDMGPVPAEREDEDKCMVGFQSADAAKSAFLMHYPKSFYEGMTALPVDVFKKNMAKAQLPHRKKKITAAFITRRECLQAFNEALDAGQCPHCNGKLDKTRHGGYDCVNCDRTWNKADVKAENDNSFGVIGDPAVGKHMDHMAKNAAKDMKKLQSINPAHMPRKESAEDYQSDRVQRTVRSTVSALASELSAKAAGCPKCKGKKIVLMPTDYETAKCKDCNHSWQVPAKLNAGGDGSGRLGHVHLESPFKVGDRVTVHFSPTLKTHGHIEGHLRKDGKVTAYMVRHAHGVMQTTTGRVTKYEKTKRAPNGTHPPRATTPGGRIQRFLEKPHLGAKAGVR